jgi:hypothetical protein
MCFTQQDQNVKPAMNAIPVQTAPTHRRRIGLLSRRLERQYDDDVLRYGPQVAEERYQARARQGKM